MHYIIRLPIFLVKRSGGVMLQIGVAAFSGTPLHQHVVCGYEFVNVIAERCGRDCVLVLGGYSGLMRVIVDAAVEKGLQVMLILPREYEGERFPSNVLLVRTGMDSSARSMILVRSSDVLVALGGGIGTIVEVFSAYGMFVPVILVSKTGLPTDRVAETFRDGLIDSRFGRLLYIVESCREAGEKALMIARSKKRLS